MKGKLFAVELLKWYSIYKRDLPWRETTDPYHIWLSEIILQQTRVNQGLPYYLKFISSYPTIKSLAKAPEQEVLRLWQGLGYYSRARNLHYSAKKLLSENNGRLPLTYEELLLVKGIGKYTAAAIASFAYQERVPVVDGNVFRVLSRIFGIEKDMMDPAGVKEFYRVAELLLPDKDHHIYNQAIMEFGALHCTPAMPKCDDCVFKKTCFAYKHHLQSKLPVKSKKIKKKTRYFNYLCIRHKNKFLMKERSGQDIWKGLFEFPLVEDKKEKDYAEIIERFNKAEINVDRESKVFKHILTHQTIYSKFYVISIKELRDFNKILKDSKCKPYNQHEIKKLPKSVLINKFLEEYIFV